jgi:GNAT superfamily N-acetyltransferase
MIIRKASLDDIDILIKLRMDYLFNERGRILTQEEQENLKEKLRAYFQKYMPDSGFIAYIAEDNGRTLSGAFLSIAERPPQNALSSSFVGTVYNVYTYPEFRRKGIASKVMNALLEEAERLDVVYIDLLASGEGKELYEKLGFGLPKYTYMRRK